MREGRPSFTAGAVAAARAIAGVDSLAPALLDGLLAIVARVGRAGRVPAAAINVATLGLVDHVAIRTRAIDAALRDGVQGGLRQLVVLGAGLDARAWRLTELAEVRVFEVDHPSTQAFKRARVSGRAPAAKEVTFVAVDFGEDVLADALARAGHDAEAPTFWIWEGVTPYLPLGATRGTLVSIAARSAAASRLAVTYATPEGLTLGPVALSAARVAFRILGEALLGLMTPETMKGELVAVGFRLLDDASLQEWSARDGGGRKQLLLVNERLAVAVSDGRPRASRAA